MPTLHDPVLAGYLAAIDLCAPLVTDPEVHPIGRDWCARTLQHLSRDLNAHLTGRPVLPSAAQGAHQFVAALASSLRDAGVALDRAAAQLREAGKGYQASQTKQASTRALHDAEAVLHA